MLKKLLKAGEGWEQPEKDDRVFGAHLHHSKTAAVLTSLCSASFTASSALVVHPHAVPMHAVHYTGTLTDGTKFDSSVDRGEPFDFTLGQGGVIKGWDVAVATMKKGEKVQLTLRHDYAYGENGNPPTIPPSATLVCPPRHWLPSACCFALSVLLLKPAHMACAGPIHCPKRMLAHLHSRMQAPAPG